MKLTHPPTTWKRLRPLLLQTAGIAVLTCMGCASEVPSVVEKLVPVTVQVLLNGAPLPHATVTLIPQQGQQDTVSAAAITGEDGHCQPVSAVPSVSLNRLRGVAVGKYAVTVSKLVMPDGTALPPETTDAEAMERGAKESVPVHYSRFENTTLEVDITPDSDVLKFELQEGSRRPGKTMVHPYRT